MRCRRSDALPGRDSHDHSHPLPPTRIHTAPSTSHKHTPKCYNAPGERCSHPRFTSEETEAQVRQHAQAHVTKPAFNPRAYVLSAMLPRLSRASTRGHLCVYVHDCIQPPAKMQATSKL